MCGIAAVSLASTLDVDRSALLRLLLASQFERGADATGFAYHDAGGTVQVTKDSLSLDRFWARIHVPATARTMIGHVRWFTQGSPVVNDNNHPIRYDHIV